MEDQYVSPLDGIEVEREDFDLVSKNAALADDRVFAELLRMRAGSTPVDRGIFCSSFSNAEEQSAVITTVPSLGGKVVIHPFRAFIASINPVTAKDTWRDIRSAIAISPEVAGGNLYQSQQLAAATNNRWDLVYARVDIEIDDDSDIRYVKDISDNIGALSIVKSKSTTVQIGVVQGTEATIPSRPAVPADSGSSYFIPLAYVLLPAGHLSTDTILKANIFEVAPVLQLSHAVGASSLRIATGSYRTNGAIILNQDWTPSAGRPKGFLPATMGGQEACVFALSFNGAASSVPLGTDTLIDDSTDWQNRYIKVTASIGNNLGNYQLANTPGGTEWIPDGRFPAVVVMGQSFHETSPGTFKAVIARFNSSNTGGAMAGQVDVYVLAETGGDGPLAVDVSGTDPQCEMVIWIEATGQFKNAL